METNLTTEIAMESDFLQRSEDFSNKNSLYSLTSKEANEMSEDLGSGRLSPQQLKKLTQSKVRLTRESEGELIDKINKLLKDAFFVKQKSVSEIKKAIASLGTGYVNYEKMAKKLVWNAKESFDELYKKSKTTKEEKLSKSLSSFFKHQYGNTGEKDKKELAEAIKQAEKKCAGNQEFLNAIGPLKSFVVDGQISSQNNTGLSEEQLQLLANYNDEGGMFKRFLNMSSDANTKFNEFYQEFRRLADQLHARGYEFKKRRPEVSDYLDKPYPYKLEWIAEKVK